MAINLPSRRLVSQEDAQLNPQARVPRSKFSGSWSHKTTFNAGALIPFLVDEILPADLMRYDVTAMIRMNTPFYPLMDSQRVDTFFFFVPMRLVWQNTARFFGEQDSPTDSIEYTIPQLVSPAGGFAEHSLADHFGLPTSLSPGETISVNALIFRAYYLIYHEWFRDQNVMSSTKPAIGDGPDLVATYLIRERAKSADYFTAALPWPQKFTSPSFGVGAQAPVYGVAIGSATDPIDGSPAAHYEYGATPAAGWAGYVPGNSVMFAAANSGASTGGPDIYADLSSISGLDVQSFRQAFLVQAHLEGMARAGSRYTEIVRRQFGVRPPDYRLQRPELIGSGSSPLNVTPVAQTAPSALPVGTLGAAATSVGMHSASFAATEHGYVLGIINVKSELSYDKGLHPMWTRETRLDLAIPELGGLSEQPIYRREIYCTGVDLDDVTVFGYQERYHEYRTRVSEVTGYFRTHATGTLAAWHLAQNFTSAPVLGPTFLYDRPPMERILTGGEEAENQQYLADILIRREATRPLPQFGIPASLGRF